MPVSSLLFQAGMQPGKSARAWAQGIF